MRVTHNPGYLVGTAVAAVGFAPTCACIQTWVFGRFGDRKATQVDRWFVRRFRIIGPLLLGVGVLVVFPSWLTEVAIGTK